MTFRAHTLLTFAGCLGEKVGPINALIGNVASWIAPDVRVAATNYCNYPYPYQVCFDGSCTCIDPSVCSIGQAYIVYMSRDGTCNSIDYSCLQCADQTGCGASC